MYKKILVSLVIAAVTIFLIASFTRVNASETHMVIFNPSGGTVSPDTKEVEYGQEYGDLPVPQNGDQTFIGWFKQVYTPLESQRFFYDSYFGRNVVRLAPGDETTNGLFQYGDTLEFDVTINNTVPIGADINDNDLSSEDYTIDGNRIYGRVTIGQQHYAKWGENGYSFLDINCQGSVTGYTVNAFKLFKSIDGEVQIKSDSTFDEHNNVELYAKWDTAPKQKTYTLTCGDGTAIFDFSEGHNFVLTFLDTLKYTPEQIEELFEVPAELYNQIKETAINNTKPYGTLLGLYAITIDEDLGTESFGYSDELTLKIKLTEALKKYGSFKLIYLDDENNFVVSEVVSLEEIDGELVGNLKHLSAYALVGTEKQEEASEGNESGTNNPQTSDNIIKDVVMLVLSLSGLAVGIVLFKKLK